MSALTAEAKASETKQATSFPTSAPEYARIPASEAKPSPYTVPAIFCATIALSFATLAVTPMLMEREYLFAFFLAPLALAAGMCFSGILTMNFFFDEGTPHS